MSLKVKRAFGGFAVINDQGEQVKLFTGSGAKAEAEKFAASPEAAESAQVDASEAEYWKGNRERGGQRGGRA